MLYEVITLKVLIEIGGGNVTQRPAGGHGEHCRAQGKVQTPEQLGRGQSYNFV